MEVTAGLVGAAATVAHYGLGDVAPAVIVPLSLTVIASLLLPAISQGLRYLWSRARRNFLEENWFELTFTAIWLAGLLVIAAWPSGSGVVPPTVDGGLIEGGEIAATAELPSDSWLATRWMAIIRWSEQVTLVRGLVEVNVTIRRAADAGLNPALVLASSFLILIGIGTLLLMLPRCRPEGAAPASWLVALFTSTSACCVTGLNVVDPGTYWSRTGQWVILGLIQVGGLGIMTFGAFFAVVLGRNTVRESATFRDLLESQRAADVGGLLRAIVGFTLFIELLGMGALSTLWPDLPWSERLFYGLFHSVSAFCNAGFCLRSESLMGWELAWQVWGVMPVLIILGGFGFMPMQNLTMVAVDRLRRRVGRVPETPRPRLTLTTKLVALTTFWLLVLGAVVLFCFEYNNPKHPSGITRQVANAWFHSVTLRTAGFNTLDHEQLTPASKLFGVSLMFIGASPGSTGGGVKTVCLALLYLTLRAVLRGRHSVESSGRTIPQEQVFRGLAVIGIALLTMMTTCLLIVVIEDQPERFIDHLYESASALGTVGVSANLTPQLQPASQLVLVVTMFLGRIGPLTLIVALAGFARPGNYSYPDERIALG